MLRGRICSYRQANFLLKEPRPWKRFLGEHCRRRRHLLLRRTRCRRAIRWHQHPLRCPLGHDRKQLRVTTHVRRHAANLRLRVRAASVPPRRQTHRGPASLAALFEQRALHNLRSLGLYTNVETQHTTHHLENASLFAEYDYVSTASAGHHLRGGNKLKVLNTHVANRLRVEGEI